MGMHETRTRTGHLNAMRRLATAILHAGGRCTESPRRIAGPIASLLMDVLPSQPEDTVDLSNACATLRGLGPEPVRVLATALAEIAVVDGSPTAEMRATFTSVTRALDVPAAEGRMLLEQAIAARLTAFSAEPPAMAAAGRAASREALDLAYLQEVVRFDPVAMAQLGPEFAALAVHRLADVTLLYELEACLFDTDLQGCGDTAVQTPESNPRASGVET